ncbi:MAG: calcium-binding protein [Acidobacteriota bacterium]
MSKPCAVRVPQTRAGIALLALVLAAGPSSAAVVVTDSGDFAISIDNNDAVSVDCFAGFVRVTDDGTPTTYATACATVRTFAVTATGVFANTISLGGVTAAAFSALNPTVPTVSISAGAGDDLVTGSELADQILGGPGTDTMVGGAARDLFLWNPGDGSDTIQGGAGFDLLIFNGSEAAEAFAVVADGTGFDLTRDVGNVVIDAEAVETITLDAKGGVDTVTVGNLTGVVDLLTFNLVLGEGDDVLDASAQANPTVGLLIDGRPGNDTLTGSPGGDIFEGGAGNDTIMGIGNADSIDGGIGDDTIVGGAGDDTLLGNDGNDTFIWNPGDGSDRVFGHAGVDTMIFNGSAASEVFAVEVNFSFFRLTRDVGNIVMEIEVETLTLNALGGNDTATVADLTGVTDLTAINLVMGDGDDTVNAAAQANAAIALTIDGGAGNDNLTGSPNADTINGGAGNDMIAGLGGVDVLDGGDGDDSITGGPANETQLGGAGNDTFTWNPGDGSDTLLGGAGTDTMVFNGSGGNEVFAVTAEGTGFDFTRDVGNVVMDADGVEALTLNALGGDDRVTTVGLAGASQSLSGGAETTADVLTIDAMGQCLVNSTAGSVTIAGAQPITFTGFEQVNLEGQCIVDVPTLNPLALAAMAAFLALAAFVLIRLQSSA